MKYGFLFFFLLMSCGKYTKTAGAIDVQIRVLLDSQKSFSIKPKGNYIVVSGTNNFLTSGNLKFQIKNKRLIVNNIDMVTNIIHIEGTKLFHYKNNVYRDSFTVYMDNNRLHLINNINMEHYLISVIPAEIFPSWNTDALKAQAIASRTYALYEVKRNKNKYFDLYSDIRSQVYKGVKSETDRTTKAVLETTGQVLTYNDKLIKSYFSASVGVKTASGKEIGDDKPYLQSQSLPLGKHQHSLWETEISAKSLQKKLKLYAPIAKVNITQRTPSGRIQTITLTDQRGKTIEFTGEKFRQSLGYGVMKSTYAQISTPNKNTVLIKGRGYGHGVGMGQWEAQDMAKSGMEYSSILKHFYHDTKITSLY